MADQNPLYNKLTKPIRDSKMDLILNQLPVSELFPKDLEFNFKERLTVKNKLLDKFIPWVHDFFTGLDGFKYKYIANGNSDAVNMVLLQHNYDKIFYLENEYSYYSHICNSLKLRSEVFNEISIDKITINDLVLISLPSSYDGDSEGKIKIINELQKRNCKVFVDVAYCGLTKPFNFHFQSTKNTYFAFTFSKTLSLAYNRIAVIFSDTEIPGLAVMNKIGYLNLSGANAALTLMNNFKPDYVYETYKDQYSTICSRLNLTETKCILFGHDIAGDKFCTSQEYTLF
jgi:hypothetical protein